MHSLNIQETNSQTGRVTLRSLQTSDARDVQRLVSEWDIARMTTRIPHPYPENAAADWIATHDTLRKDKTEFVFGVDYLGQIAGCVGLHHVEPRLEGVMELGYWIGTPYWGYGLATEAGRGALSFAFNELGLGAVAAWHFADNPASGRVLAKLGFLRVGHGRMHSAARCGEALAVRLVLPRDAWTGTRV